MLERAGYCDGGWQLAKLLDMIVTADLNDVFTDNAGMHCPSEEEIEDRDKARAALKLLGELRYREKEGIL